jgi:response regulator RpfG family c-di-GMP phosphodiesterase
LIRGLLHANPLLRAAEMIPDKILFVDDEKHILDAMTRQLRKNFVVETADSAPNALLKLKNVGPFAVVVSDLRMPEMDGIELLSHVRKNFPDVIRIMLSGNADLNTAIEAVNNGQIFRFLTKPCSLTTLESTLNLAIRQYQLVISERELLNKTLKGSIAMLSELLSLTNPRAFSRGYRIKPMVKELAGRMGVKQLWQYEIAALTCQVGCIAVPADILKKAFLGENLSSKESSMFEDHPRVGAHLVGQIPRLDGVADIIKNHLKPFDDPSATEDIDQSIAIGAQILKAALDYDLLIYKGDAHQDAISQPYGREGQYNPEVLAHLNSMSPQQQKRENETVDLFFDELVPGMTAAENVLAKNGSLIIEKGQEITWPTLQGLQNFIQHIGIQEPIKVWSK